MAYKGTNTDNYNFFLPDDNSSGWGSAMRSFIDIVDEELGKIWAEIRSIKNRLTGVEGRVDGLERATVTANFAFNGSDGNLTFTATASTEKGTVDGYTWTFGDGLSGSGQSVQHTYAKSGDYPVSLTVATSTGAARIVTRTASVTVKSAPSSLDASFTASVGDGGLVSFQAVAGVSDGTVDSYSWDFGDGGLASGSAASHTYAAAGTYNVILTVRATTLGGQLTKTVTSTVTPRVSSPSPSVITASFTPTVGANGLVSFSAEASTSRGSVTSLIWNFGDGASGAGQATSHTYAAAQTYTVTLTVGDSTGNAVTVSKSVTPAFQAADDFTADFTLQKTVATDGSTGKTYEHYAFSALQDNSNGKMASYAWSFPGGNPSSYQAGSAQTYSAATIYAANGTYNASLTVTHTDGRNKTVTKAISVTGAGVTATPSGPSTIAVTDGLTAYLLVSNLNDTNGGTYSDYQVRGTGIGYLGAGGLSHTVPASTTLPAPSASNYPETTRFKVASVTATREFVDQETKETSVESVAVDPATLSLYAGDRYVPGTTDGGRAYTSQTVQRPAALDPTGFTIKQIGDRPMLFADMPADALLTVSRIVLTVF